MFDMIARAMANNAESKARIAAPYIVTFTVNGNVIEADHTVEEVLDAMKTKIVIATLNGSAIGSPIAKDTSSIGWIPYESTYIISNLNGSWVYHVTD